MLATFNKSSLLQHYLIQANSTYSPMVSKSPFVSLFITPLFNLSITMESAIRPSILKFHSQHKTTPKMEHQQNSVIDKNKQDPENNFETLIRKPNWVSPKKMGNLNVSYMIKTKHAINEEEEICIPIN